MRRRPSVKSAYFHLSQPRLVRRSSAMIVGIGLALILGGLVIAVGNSPSAGAAAVGQSSLGLASTPTDASGSVMALSGSVSPSAICALGSSSCPAGTGVARVTLSAALGSGGSHAWGSVQVLFLLETTPYNGVYDPSSSGGDPGFDRCGSPAYSGRTLCEESNGVPVFVASAGNIAAGIQRANPNTQVSFGLVDYFSTSAGPWDDSDGSPYHVDVGNFVTASEFGPLVHSTFQASQLGGGFTVPDSDLHDNFLDSPIITAMYGAIAGNGLSWSNGSHHVIVSIGSTAPRDPGYSENYCVSPHALSVTQSGQGCWSATCEPSFTFAIDLTSPTCLGWVRSHNGNPADSIAALSIAGPACENSAGGRCTVDVIELPTTSTDPNSPGWPNRTATIQQDHQRIADNVVHVLVAGCDMAQATNGSWDGPIGSTCPDGTGGTLPFVTTFGPPDHPYVQNPQLIASLSRISFGAPPASSVLYGAGHPMFTFLPLPPFVIAPQPQATAACLHQGVPLNGCPSAWPLPVGSGNGLAWNWSTVPSRNVMVEGDVWTASFNVMASGPPYAFLPVDSCVTPECRAAGSGALQGLYSWAETLPLLTGGPTTVSFPLVQLRVELPSGSASLSSPPPVIPGNPPPLSVSPPLALPGVQPVAAGPSVSIANVSIQALAAGVIAAGFTRIAVKNRSVAIRIAARAGPTRSGVKPDGSERPVCPD